MSNGVVLIKLGVIRWTESLHFLEALFSSVKCWVPCLTENIFNWKEPTTVTKQSYRRSTYNTHGAIIGRHQTGCNTYSALAWPNSGPYTANPSLKFVYWHNGILILDSRVVEMNRVHVHYKKKYYTQMMRVFAKNVQECLVYFNFDLI